ncbi:sigma-70 domain-containing protein [Clostridium sp. E02]|uniref:sigma-70 domain-containing protein n=1 Tax=Clostridium sp. E02 TaxID=2487134 RepID=UPI000F54B328|nr:sigma-70 domain-containing protein [Clostridium sp. E02]
MHDDFYQMYLNEMEEIKPCSGEEQKDLIQKMKDGNESAKSRLVEGNLRIALEYAKEYDGKGVLLTDLVQEANMALVIAVDDYIGLDDMIDFDSFVRDHIRKALDDLIEEEKFADQTEEELAARVNVLQTVSQMLAKELGREATIEELAAKMKMSVDEIKGIMKIAIDAMSMNAENMDLDVLSEAEGIEIIETQDEEE